MAHMLETVDGKVSFFSARGVTAWHGLGQVVSGTATAAAAIKLAGLDWEAHKVPMFTSAGNLIPNHHAVQRSTDQAILGVVGDRYKVLQNHEAFSFFDPFVQAGEAEYATAGSLCGGSRVWVLAKINREAEEIVPGDKIEKYVLLSNSHDGTISVHVGFTPTRVVCANTLQQAHGSKASKLLKVRHSASMGSTLASIRETIDTIDGEFRATADVYRQLARVGMSKSDLKEYVCRVFGADPSDPPRALAQIEANFDHGAGSDVAGDTVWGGYNAVTDYLTWSAGRTEENRLNSNSYGMGATVNAKALNLAYNYVTVGGF